MAKKRAKVPGLPTLVDTYEWAVQEGDPLLEQPAKHVAVWDRNIQTIGMRLKHLVRADKRSLGLSAPQIGCPWRVIAYRDEKLDVHALTNPVVIEVGERKVVEWEGCFSLKRGMVRVPRYDYVTVEAESLQGLPVRVRAFGVVARCLQHEIDHLEGHLITRYGDAVKRDLEEGPEPVEIAVPTIHDLELLHKDLG